MFLQQLAEVFGNLLTWTQPCSCRLGHSREMTAIPQDRRLFLGTLLLGQ